MVLSTLRRGVAACICHMFTGQGVPGVSLGLADLAHHRGGGAGIPRQFPAIRYIVVDGANSKSQELMHLAGILQQMHLVSEHFTVVIIGDDGAAIEAASMNQLNDVAFVRSLPELMIAAGVPSESPLTTRERAVLEFISGGATNQQTANALGISIATVKTYLERSQAKLKSRDRASTVSAALRRGWM